MGKKYITYLLSLLVPLVTLGLINQANANYDSPPPPVIYSGKVYAPFNMKVTTDECGIKVDFEKDIYDILNITNPNCSKGSDAKGKFIYCSVMSSPFSGTLTTDVIVKGDRNEILTELGLPKNLISSLEDGEYSQTFPLLLNKGNTGEYNFNEVREPFLMFENDLVIFEPSECNGSTIPRDTTIVGEPVQNVLDPEEAKVPPRQVKPPVIYDITIENQNICKYIGQDTTDANTKEYNCYASSTIPLSYTLEDLGNGYNRGSNITYIDDETKAGVAALETYVNVGDNVSEAKDIQIIDVDITNKNPTIVNFTSNSFKKTQTIYVESYAYGIKGNGLTQSKKTKRVKINIIPNNLGASTTPLDTTNSDTTEAYANGKDTHKICSQIVDSFGNPLINVGLNKDQFNVEVKDGIKLDQIKNLGEAIQVDNTNKTFDSNGILCFHPYSYSPDIKNVSFKITYAKHDLLPIKLNNTNKEQKLSVENLEFKKPITGKLKASGTATVGSTLEYTIDFLNSGRLTSNYSFEQLVKNNKNAFNNNFYLTDDSLKINDESNIFIYYSPSKEKIKLEAKIVATGDATIKPNIETKPTININFGNGNIAKYIITQKEKGNDNTIISLDGASQENTGIRIIGGVQGSGYPSLTGGDANFSDVTVGEVRGTLKQKIDSITNGLNNGDIVNKVKYIEGDIELNSNDSDFGTYKTLVVKNGNITITSNINSSIGIVALKDDNLSNKGNIYIKPNVTYIKALMYADGSLESVDNNGNIFNTNDNNRTNILNKQLVIEGSTFTRNTVGGADITDGGTYRLPGNASTTNLDKAQRFDLAHLREGNEGWFIDANSNGIKDDGECQNNNDCYEDKVIIRYNYETLKDTIPGF